MKLIWTDPCIDDLRSIRDYIARDSEYYAAEVVSQIILSAESLVRFPRLGRAVPELQNESIREILYRDYRIIYRIRGEKIEILTIVHGGKDPSYLQTSPWKIG